MSKIKTALVETEPDPELVDERGPTLERVKQASWGDIEVGDSGVITIRQNPMERAVRRETFTRQQGHAARRFYEHWYEAQLAGNLPSMELDRVFSTDLDFSRLGKTERSFAHWVAFHKAEKAIEAGMDGGGFRKDHAIKLMQLIVCKEIPFAEAGRAIGFEGRDAEVMARTYMRGSLNILITLWGL